MVLTLILNPPGQNNAPFLDFAIIAAVELLSIAVLHLLDVPMTFHAEITGKFDLFGAFRFTTDFWKKVGFVALGTGLVYLFLGTIVLVLGFLCCFVGIYPAIALNQMAGQHLMSQLYRLYLYRGGEPLREYRPKRRKVRYELDDEDEWDEEDEDDEDDEDKHE